MLQIANLCYKCYVTGICYKYPDVTNETVSVVPNFDKLDFKRFYQDFRSFSANRERFPLESLAMYST